MLCINASLKVFCCWCDIFLKLNFGSMCHVFRNYLCVLSLYSFVPVELLAPTFHTFGRTTRNTHHKMIKHTQHSATQTNVTKTKLFVQLICFAHFCFHCMELRWMIYVPKLKQYCSVSISLLFAVVVLICYFGFVSLLCC